MVLSLFTGDRVNHPVIDPGLQAHASWWLLSLNKLGIVKEESCRTESWDTSILVHTLH